MTAKHCELTSCFLISDLLPDLLLMLIFGIRLDNKDVPLNACRLSFIADKIQHLELTTFDNVYDDVKDKE